VTTRLRSSFALLAVALLGPHVASAYNLIGGSWPSGSIRVSVQLDATAPTSPSLPLTDGSTSWNALAFGAASDWNTVLSRSQLALTPSSATTHKFGDGASDIFFDTTIYGQRFQSGVLAVTLVDHYDDDDVARVRTREADLIVNRNLGQGWNSYRGAIRSSPIDLRRVLLHELGHVLGLTHPDESTPAENRQITNAVQNVAAVMNSAVSNTEALQTDDINGVSFLYRTIVARPIVTKPLATQVVNVASSVTLAPTIDGATPLADAFHDYIWYFKAAGTTSFEKLFTINSPTLSFGSAQLSDSGGYYVEISTADDTVLTDPVTLTVNPIATSTTTALANLSTRGVAGSGSSSMIVGFVVSGSRSKNVLLRSVGPTLGTAPFNVAGTLGNPLLTLKNSSQVTVATSNAVWDQSANLADIRAATSRVGAFALTPSSSDAVILASLAPGSYTAVTSSPTGGSGVVLVEAYDADPERDPTSRLANLSSRGRVNTGDNLLIAGFVVSGPGPRTYLIRLAGDTLRSFNVTGTLDDPILRLFDGRGALLRELDDWDSPKAAQNGLSAAFAQVGAFAFSDRQESAMLVTLPPGSYTAQATGNANFGTSSPTGVALIEIYEMP